MEKRPIDMLPLVALIDRYHSGFADRICPAPSDIVEQLAELAGPLPGAYLRFLETMGGDTAGFAPSGGDFNVEDRLLNYQLNESLREKQYLLIAAGSPAEPDSLFLDRDTPFAQDDCQVALATYASPMTFDDVTPFHAGFEELLYLEAYRIYRMPKLSGRIELALRPDVIAESAIFDQVLAMGRQLGFALVPPVTRSALFERGDAAMMVFRSPTSELFSLRIGATDLNEVKQIGDLLMEQIPLTPLFG